VLLQCAQHPDTRVQIQALWALANLSHRNGCRFVTQSKV
jgi:hypothetical protein